MSREIALFTLVTVAAMAANAGCSGTVTTRSGGEGVKGAGGGGTETSDAAGTGGRVASAGGGSSRGGSAGQTSGAHDAGAAPDGPCSPRTHWMNVAQGADGGCYGTLPFPVAPSRLEIDAVVGGVASGPLPVPLRKIDGPCGSQPGFRISGPDQVELCSLCFSSLGASYQVVEHCSDIPEPVDASTDACVPGKAVLSIRTVGSDCFLDLPPDADRTVPIALAGEFGMLAMTYYLSGIDASACSQGQDGWLPVSGDTVRVCGQACTIFGSAPYTVTLKCGVTRPSDASATD